MVQLRLIVVRETGLEPVRWKHTPLKRARLPIPPLPRTNSIIQQNSPNVNTFFEKNKKYCRNNFVDKKVIKMVEYKYRKINAFISEIEAKGDKNGT